MQPEPSGPQTENTHQRSERKPLVRRRGTFRSLTLGRVALTVGLMAGAVLALLATLAGSAASAQEYPTTGGTLTVEDATVSPGGDAPATDDNDAVSVGQELRIVGGGFLPGSEVIITIESEPIVVAVTTADANGEIDISVLVPAGVPTGDHTFKAAGDSAVGGRLVLEKPVTVAPAGAPMAAVDSAGGSSGLQSKLLIGALAFGLAAAVGAWLWSRSEKSSFTLPSLRGSKS